jgi:hypothetical protein
VNDPEEWFYNEDPDHERWELELRVSAIACQTESKLKLFLALQ